jgi:hypothetical protein
MQYTVWTTVNSYSGERPEFFIKVARLVGEIWRAKKQKAPFASQATEEVMTHHT